MQTITKAVFGKTRDGQEVNLYTLSNGTSQAGILDFGGTVNFLKVPDKNGGLTDVVLGYDDVSGYETNDGYLGALIGRHGNRIEKGKFVLNGQEYQLYCNDGNNHLHGGRTGFDRKIWNACVTDGGLELKLHSPDGEEGYPGNLDVTVLYSLSDDHALSISYTAVSDADTVCNLTNHTYFNLGGHDSGTVEEQSIQLFADRFTVADCESLPNGTIAFVEGTPMDLRTPTRIGLHIEDNFEQLVFAGGFDHNWVLNSWDSTMRPMAYAFDENTGVALCAYTTLPGVQFYSGNYIGEGRKGKNGAVYYKRCGFCLESQFYPNSLRHPNFPQPILKAGETWRHRTSYRFEVKE